MARPSSLARPAGTLLLAALIAGGALAAGGGGGGGGGSGGGSSGPIDLTSELNAAQQALDRHDWSGAIAELERARRKDNRNADVHNLLGYSLRKSGRLSQAFEHYDTALRLDPKHLGAHEYAGEAWLLARRPDKAREHLAALARLCGERCEQYADLAKAVAAYDAGPPVLQSSSSQ